MPVKISAFIWKAVQNRIPVYPNLQVRGLWHKDLPICCKLCDAGCDETTIHLFFECNLAVRVWHNLCSWLDIPALQWNDATPNFPGLSSCFAKYFKEVGLIFWQSAVWFIWKSRNECVFRGTKKTCSDIMELIKFNTWTWIKNKMAINSAYSMVDWMVCPKGVVLDSCLF